MLYIKTFFFLNIDRYLLKKTYCSSLYLIAQRLKKQTKSRKKKVALSYVHITYEIDASLTLNNIESLIIKLIIPKVQNSDLQGNKSF